jgi:Flp pilus assembly protein TadD
MSWDARESNLRQADTASRKALELDPELAEAHAARGFALSLSRRFDEAEREFETAMRLDPKLYEAPYFYGRTCRAQGKLAEAARLFERASEVRPDDYIAPGFLGDVYAELGRRAEAEAAWGRSVRLTEPRLELNPDDARALNFGAATLMKIGESARALDWARQSLAIDPEDATMLYNVACVYALGGRSDEAIACLERAVDNGFGHKDWLEHDSDLDSLRGQPRFEALVERM